MCASGFFISQIYVNTEHTFGKEEKLKSRKLIASIFEQGFSVNSYPIRAKVLSIDDGEPKIQVTFVASKRYFKKAVDRNRIKRQMKEAYRCCKHTYHPSWIASNKSLYIVFIYNTNHKEDYTVISKGVEKVLNKIKV